MSQQYYEPPPYQPPPPRPERRFGLDTWSLALIALVGVGGVVCLVGIGIFCMLVLITPAPPAPATPRPVVETTTISAGSVNIIPTNAPTVNAANIGIFVNPYVSAQLEGMTVMQIDVRDEATGNYVRAQQLTGSDLDKFVEAFNVSVKTVAPDSNCPDHVRLSITRADNSVVTIGVCLKQVVILRGGIPDLGGADAPMYPGFSDALAPYLPEAYRSLLDF
ncbi:MAG: hypothetical protein IT324_16130 [Anaerolineae bacterium]|nr:hypothetical protein [Anaerolineae bacterium]